MFGFLEENYYQFKKKKKLNKMPVHRGQDKTGPFYQDGKKGKKYHYIPNSKTSRTIAKDKAKKQAEAIHASKK